MCQVRLLVPVFRKLELLYLEKYWLQVSIFLATLTFVNIVNISTFLYADEITTWLNGVMTIVKIHSLDLTKWVWIYGVGVFFLLGNYFVYMIMMYKTEITPGVVGGTNALTVVLFHYIDKEVRLDFALFPLLSSLTLLIEMYVLICACCCFAFPMLCSILVRNMAQHRNLRVGLLIGTG